MSELATPTTNDVRPRAEVIRLSGANIARITPADARVVVFHRGAYTTYDNYDHMVQTFLADVARDALRARERQELEEIRKLEAEAQALAARDRARDRAAAVETRALMTTPGLAWAERQVFAATVLILTVVMCGALI